jgi:sarcosine oxidase subunit alpha
MTGVVRLATGGEIDRGRPVPFSFDGVSLSGYEGDTIASALLANGVSVVARSFKVHRPRGIFAAGVEEPNAILDLRSGARHDPNARATIEPLVANMVLRSIHAAGNASRDRLAFLDRLHRFVPSGFYYKTFLWPNWRFYERSIRRLAGLGRVDFAAREIGAHHRFLSVDICVIGGGAAGIAAALAGVRLGRRVVLVDEQNRLGGSLLYRDASIDGSPASAWITAARQELAKGDGTILLGATAFGLYDGNEVAIVERGAPTAGDNGERLWRVRAESVIVATGAIERPLLFANNDRPGIMLAGAALSYLRRHALRLGARVAIATSNDSAYELAGGLRAAGAEVTVLDHRKVVAADLNAQGVAVRLNSHVQDVIGSPRLQGVRLEDGTVLEADFLFVSGGWTPSLHLYAQARGRPRWSHEIGAFVPGDSVPGILVAGAANGAFDLHEALAQGYRAGGGGESGVPSATPQSLQWSCPSILPSTGVRGRIWVDLQSDVTMDDIKLAARENFASVEHLKRYTTLGMANDQGKTSNLVGLAALAQATGRDMATLGLTTYRPPYAPVSMATIAGRLQGELYAPLRRLPAESCHRDNGAHFREYGGILRPAWYGLDAECIASECRSARLAAVAFDGSSLGKIEVIGPDAPALLDFVFYTRMSTLAPGRLRYGLMLTEGGIVFDDGVVLRLSDDRFVVSCSSSHVSALAQHMEEWRQDSFDARRVFVHDATAHWATIAIAGPKSRSIVEALDLGLGEDLDNLPHMAMRTGTFQEQRIRVARVSFTGERSYEISLPAGSASDLWRKALLLGARPMGLEALSILRAEKGYFIVGQDTDGETMPHDLGINGPRDKRTDAYVGDRSLFTPCARRPGRKQLVGIAPRGEALLPAGAHAIGSDSRGRRSLGYVTSGYFSHTLNRPVALGLVEDGRARFGEVLEFEYLGKRTFGTLVAPCFLDPTGDRLNA